MLYLAVALSSSIRTGAHRSLRVAGLAVRAGDVTLALGALWGTWRQDQASVIGNMTG